MIIYQVYATGTLQTDSHIEWVLTDALLSLRHLHWVRNDNILIRLRHLQRNEYVVTKLKI